MPKAITFSKEKIIETAFKLVQKKGLDALSARNIGQALGSSQVPIYSQFKSMKEVEQVVRKKTYELFLEYLRKEYTDRVFLNIGTGICVFARDEDKLFPLIVGADSLDEFLGNLHKEMKKDFRFTRMPQKKRKDLLYKMWVYTFGLANLINKGFIKDCSDKFIINDLLNIGTIVIKDALSSK